MATNPTLKAFRDRPRAVCLCVCARSETTALSASLIDARLWIGINAKGEPSSPAGAFVMIQGRVEAGDWVLFSIVRKHDKLRIWTQHRQAGAPLRGVVQIGVALEGLRIPSKGMYNLQCHVNMRLAGKVEVEAI